MEYCLVNIVMEHHADLPTGKPRPQKEPKDTRKVSAPVLFVSFIIIFCRVADHVIVHVKIQLNLRILHSVNLHRKHRCLRIRFSLHKQYRRRQNRRRANWHHNKYGWIVQLTSIDFQGSSFHFCLPSWMSSTGSCSGSTFKRFGFVHFLIRRCKNEE